MNLDESNKSTPDELATPVPETKTTLPTEPSKKLSLPALILLIFLVAMITVALFFSFSNMKKKETVPSYTNPFESQQKVQEQVPQQPSPTYANPFNEPSPTYANPFNDSGNQTTDTPYQNPFEGVK
jgi:hypothetical protein